MRGVVRSVVRAGLSTAIQGGRFDKQLLENLRGVGVSQVLAGVQGAIGDLTDGTGARDLPVMNMIAHALAGGLAAKATGGKFEAGAAAALSSAIAANAGLFSGLSQEQLSAISQLIGATAALLVGGDGVDVNQGASIAQSAAFYNYLTHEEIKEFESRLKACKKDIKCNKAELFQAYKTLSYLHSQELAACGTDNACVARHLLRIAKAAVAAEEFYKNAPLPPLLRKNLDMIQTADFRRAVATFRYNHYLQSVCPGLEAGCVRRVKLGSGLNKVVCMFGLMCFPSTVDSQREGLANV